MKTKMDIADQTAHILVDLEASFYTDAQRMTELEQDLLAELADARRCGESHTSVDWNRKWHQQWDNVEGTLGRMRGQLKQMSHATGKNHRELRKQALEAWEHFQTEETKLMEILSAIRVQATGLSATAHHDWNLLAYKLDAHLRTLHNWAKVLRVKLELRKNHSLEDVNRLVESILKKHPDPSEEHSTALETDAREYHRAVTELEQEHHEFLGVMDIVKSLMLWVETPEERAYKNRSLRIESSEAQPRPT